MKKHMLIFSIILIILICSVSSINATDVKTHEFTYAKAAVFNISDELTDKTHVDNIVFGEGVSYEYDNGIINMLGGLIADGVSDPVESNENDAYYEVIDSKNTTQGYETHIFKSDIGDDQYEVYIDLNNITITQDDGFSSEYSYFWGTFDTLEEAQIFIDTFKIINN